MTELERINVELNLTLGRVNGLHLLMVCLTRSLTPETAAKAVQITAAALERVEADLLGTPIPDQQMNETVRIVREGLGILQAASREGQ